jgi:ATP-dependent exoDNAse (exonuclease V) beta subunit
LVHDWATGLSGLKVNGVTEANYLKLKYGGPPITEEPVLEDEEKRVLYVAATRAKKEIFFTCLENGSGKEVLQLLQAMFPFLQTKEEASSSAFDLIEPVLPEYESLESVLQKWKTIEDIASLRSGVTVDSVTLEAEKLEPGDAELSEIAARAKQSGGTLVGLLCHGALEKWNFEQPDDLNHLLRIEKGKYARNFSKDQIDRAAAASGEILKTFVRSKAAEWLKSVEIVGREIPVSYFDRVTRKVLSGKIDLLVKEGGQHVIVDYKTDHEISDSMRKRYAEQMRIYAQALAESVANPIACKLLLLRTSQLIEL